MKTSGWWCVVGAAVGLVACGNEPGERAATTNPPSATTPVDTSLAEATVVETVTESEGTTVAETTAAETIPEETAPEETAPEETAPNPCIGLDRDGDGLVDACDTCPEIPRVLLFDVNASLRHGRRALELLGCDFTVAGVDDFVTRLAAGDYGAAVLDMPDARPQGAWAQALLDFIQRGGAVVLSGWRLDQVPGPSIPATFGARLLEELADPRDFTPTWVAPLYLAPFDVSRAAFTTDGSPAALVNGATLEATAGRVCGRTFLDGFLWDDFPFDSDHDGAPDVAELVANQLTYAARARAVAGGAPAEVPPVVTNVAADRVEVVPNDLVIVRGSSAEDADIRSQSGGEASSWPVVDGRWKALVALQPGDNWVSFAEDAAAGDGWTHLQIRHEPQTNPRRVRLVYAIASDGDGRFDAPPGVANDVASATARIALAARLLQAMISDRFAEAGLARRTFRLEPSVHVWQTSAPTAAWWAMSGNEMWSWIWGHMNELPSCGDCKTVIILGMTHWDAASGQALAHTALGGGGVALFGSGTLHTWASRLAEVPAHLADETDVTALGLFDDSGYRRSAWANYATGLGAVLHELGHALDLPHPIDHASIMNRGFDHVNRLLVAAEPPSATSGGIEGIWPVDEPTFDFSGLGRLRWHRWLALADRTYDVTAAPAVTVGPSHVRIRTDAGLRGLDDAIEVDGDWRAAGGEVNESPSPPVDYTLALDSLRFLFPGEPAVKLLITDDQGNLRDDVVVELGPGSF
jgi:hypothetical protein